MSREALEGRDTIVWLGFQGSPVADAGPAVGGQGEGKEREEAALTAASDGVSQA